MERACLLHARSWRARPGIELADVGVRKPAIAMRFHRQTALQSMADQVSWRSPSTRLLQGRQQPLILQALKAWSQCKVPCTM